MGEQTPKQSLGRIATGPAPDRSRRTNLPLQRGRNLVSTTWRLYLEPDHDNRS